MSMTDNRSKPEQGILILQILDELDRVKPAGLTAPEVQKKLKEDFQRSAALGSVAIGLRRLVEDFGWARYEESLQANEIKLRKYYITPQGMDRNKEEDHETEPANLAGALAPS